MNPNYVLPVWSFNGPSRHDGVCVGSLCEPLLACHSIRFSRFRLQRIPLITCGFVCCVPPVLCSAARRYITHSPCPCQQVSELSFGDCPPSSSCMIQDAKSASRSCPGRSQYCFGHSLWLSAMLCDRRRAASRFQHALRSPVGAGGAVSYCTRLQIRVQGISATCSK